MSRASRDERQPKAQATRNLNGMVLDWRERWSDVFKGKPAVDVLAGVTVAAVALPLNVGLAVACRLPPVAGLIAGALGRAIAAVAGGAPLLVTGPAAALSFMVLDIQKAYGATGVALAALLVGVLQLILAFTGAGKLIAKVPESVLAGFTTGVGIKLLDQQVPEFLGFPDVLDATGNSTGKPIYQLADVALMMHQPKWLHHVSLFSVVCGLFVAFFVATMAKYKRFPAAIVAIAVITFVSVYLNWDIERVGTIPTALPAASLPTIPDEAWLDLLGKVAPLGLLAAVESLLSARAIDRMVPESKPHHSSLELFGQGLANVAVGFFSGMPVTGVIARSGVNVQSGGRTRLASLVHAALLLLCVLYVGKYIAKIPIAALAGLLCVVGYRLVEVKTLVELAQHEKVEAVAFVATAVGTVSGHLMTGMVAGLALHFVNRYVHRHEEAAKAQLAKEKSRGIRAVLKGEKAEARKHKHAEPAPEHHAWLTNIREAAHRARTAYVHPAATVIGRVVMGEHVHVAAGSSVRADEGSPFFIGANTNLQDGVILHALKEKRVVVGAEEWAIYVGKNVSIAHDALVHGPCYIGDDTFVGFKAVVHDSVVGANCFIGIGAVVVGVEIPDGRHVPHGRIVDSADAVAALPLATHVHGEFNEDVVDVNRGLAVAYHKADDHTAALAHPRGTEDDVVSAARAWEPAWTPHVEKDRF
jgi:SulP family sulfate permease